VTAPSVLLAGLASTGFASCGTALKHGAARTLPPRTGSRLSQLRAAVTQPLWLFGLLADAVALSLQVIALHIGTLTVVQPLLISALLFSLLLNHWFQGTLPRRRELLSAGALLASLGAFLAVSGSAAVGTGAVESADKAVAVVAAVVATLVCIVLILLAHLHQHANKAALLGVSVACVYAATAALIKSCTNIFAVAPLDLLTSWQPYVLVLAGLLGLVLTQLAFRAGPLTASLPAIGALDPVLSVALGVWVFDEPLRSGMLASSAELLALAGLAGSAYALSRVEASPGSGGVAGVARRPAGGRTASGQGRA
jgi:hypothetical protein